MGKHSRPRYGNLRKNGLVFKSESGDWCASPNVRLPNVYFDTWREAYDYAYRNTPIPAKETWQS